MGVLFFLAASVAIGYGAVWLVGDLALANQLLRTVGRSFWLATRLLAGATFCFVGLVLNQVGMTGGKLFSRTGHKLLP